MDIASLGIKITQTGAEQVKSDISSIGDVAETTSKRVGNAGSAGAIKFAQSFADQTSKARESAHQFTTLFEQQFDADMARVREGLARGIITQAQAKKAGQEAAIAYNQGLLGQLDQLGGAGLNAGNSKAYTDLAGSLKAVGSGSENAFTGLGRVRQGLVSLLAQATGTIPVVDRIGSSLLTMGAGGVVSLAVVAGAAAISLAWDKLTESSRKAKEEQEKLTDALHKWYQEQRAGAAGSLSAEIDAAVAKLRELRAELTKADTTGNPPLLVQLKAQLQGILAGGGLAGLTANVVALRQWYADQTNAVRQGSNELAAAIKEANKKVNDAINEQVTKEVSDLAAVSQAQRATQAQQQLALQLLAGFQRDLAALQSAAPSASAGDAFRKNLDQQAALLNNIKALRDVLLEPLKEIEAEQANAAAALNTFTVANEKALESIKEHTAALDKQKPFLIGEAEALKHIAEAQAVINSLPAPKAFAAPGIAEIKKQTDELNAEIKAASVATTSVIDGFSRDLHRELSRSIASGLNEGFGAGLAKLLDTAVNLVGAYAPQISAKLFSHDVTTTAPGGGTTTSSVPGLSQHDTDLLGSFAQAATAVQGFASALNSLAGITRQTAAEQQKQFLTALQLITNITDYRLAVTGTPLQQAQSQNSQAAAQLRLQAEEGLPGKHLEAEREKQLAAINALEAIRNKQLQDEFDLKQKEATEDYAIRSLRATGLGAEADALAFAEAQQREYTKAIKDGSDTATLIALATAQQAEAAQRARDIQTTQENRAQDLGVRQLAATGGNDRQVSDAQFVIAQERELADLRKVGTQDEINALVAVQALEAAQRAADFAAVQQRAQEDYKVRQLQAEGHSNEAAALRLQLDQQREYQDAVKAGLDAATLAALALAQAAEGAAAAAKQAQDAQRALDDLQVRALTAQGNTAGADNLRFQLQQQRELEDAVAAGRSQDYLDKLKDVQAQEAQARQLAATAAATVNNAAAATRVNGQTEAVTYAAKNLTEVTGNRMADYLASINIGIKHLETIEAEQLRFWNGIGSTPLPAFNPQQTSSGNPSNPASTPAASGNVTQNTFNIRVVAPEGTDPQALARQIADEVNKILGDQFVTTQLQNGDPLKAGV